MKTLKPHTCKGSSKKPVFFTPRDWGVLWILSCVSILKLLNLQGPIYCGLKSYDVVLCFRNNWKPNRKKTYCEAPSVVWDEDKTRDALTKLSSLSVDKFWIYCEKCCHILHSIERYLEKTWNKPESKIGKKLAFTVPLKNIRST